MCFFKLAPACFEGNSTYGVFLFFAWCCLAIMSVSLSIPSRARSGRFQEAVVSLVVISQGAKKQTRDANSYAKSLFWALRLFFNGREEHIPSHHSRKPRQCRNATREPSLDCQTLSPIVETHHGKTGLVGQTGHSHKPTVYAPAWTGKTWSSKIPRAPALAKIVLLEVGLDPM